MGYSEKVSSHKTHGISLKTLREQSDVGNHRYGSTQAMGGVRRENIEMLNNSEIQLFFAAVASLVPGIDAMVPEAKQQVDKNYALAYGGDPRNDSRSVEVMAQIEAALSKHGLQAAQGKSAIR